MKKNIFIASAACLFIFIACGPAAENREAMHIRAKGFQDSIAFVIKSSMAEAAAPAGGRVVMPDTSRKMIGQGTPTIK